MSDRSRWQRLQRYFRGADLDEADNAGVVTITRLSHPLPFSVNAVAVAQLITTGITLAMCTAALAGGALFVVGSPFYFGRVGVGYSLVTLFAVSVLALVSTLPFFSARGAARILRRDARGVHPVYRYAWAAAIISAFGLAGALATPIVDAAPPLEATRNFSMVRNVVIALASLGFQVWTIVVLRNYKHRPSATGVV